LPQRICENINPDIDLQKNLKGLIERLVGEILEDFIRTTQIPVSLNAGNQKLKNIDIKQTPINTRRTSDTDKATETERNNEIDGWPKFSQALPSNTLALESFRISPDPWNSMMLNSKANVIGLDINEEVDELILVGVN
jgi:hypothetical protein